MSSNSVRVEKMHDGNYRTFKKEMEFVLMKERLWKYILNPPPLIPPPENELDLDVYQAAFEQYERDLENDQLASRMIWYNLSRGIQREIPDEYGTAKETMNWRK